MLKTHVINLSFARLTLCFIFASMNFKNGKKHESNTPKATPEIDSFTWYYC